MKGVKEYKRLHADEFGEGGCCLSCGTTSGYKAPHHIFSRARKSKHPELHNHLNLIMLCQKCHTAFERFKRDDEYNQLVEERGLNELFKKETTDEE